MKGKTVGKQSQLCMDTLWEIDWLVFQWIHNGGDKCRTFFAVETAFRMTDFANLLKTVKSETKLTQKSCFRGLDFLLEFAIILIL